jgi:hypothetical protein
LIIEVSKKNDILQIEKKPIRDGKLAINKLENEFCRGTFHVKKRSTLLGRSRGREGVF